METRYMISHTIFITGREVLPGLITGLREPSLD